MAATSSISGLASGLDTASIVSQFMALEALPQTKLKTQVSTEQSKVTALQRLNTALQALGTKVSDLGANATSSWSALAGTSSNTGVNVTASTAAAPGAFTVTIGQTALSHQAAFTAPHAKADVVTGATTSVLLKRAGQPDVQVDTANGTLEELATAINSADVGVRATLVRTGTAGGVDQYRLLVESSVTGADQAFELTDSTGADLLGGATVRAGRDASIDIGGITATSSSNTFTDVVPGLTLTLSAGATGSADIGVTRDAGTRSSAVKSLIDDINVILGQVSSLTATGTTRGLMSGDSTLRQVAGALQSAIYPAGGGSLATYGVEVDRYGKLTFDADKFAAGYQADPVAAAAAFTGPAGFAARLTAAVENASDKYTGAITSAITNRGTAITRLNENIANWDDRLELRRASLERQYTALETALARMQSQSSWLTSQLASLSASSE